MKTTSALLRARERVCTGPGAEVWRSLEVEEDIADAVDVLGIDAVASATEEVIAGEVVAAVEADGSKEDALAGEAGSLGVGDVVGGDIDRELVSPERLDGGIETNREGQRLPPRRFAKRSRRPSRRVLAAACAVGGGDDAGEHVGPAVAQRHRAEDQARVPFLGVLERESSAGKARTAGG